MPRKSHESSPSREREKAFASLDEINQAIAKLRGRIPQVEELKKEGLPYLDALKVTAEFQIKETIREIFGAHSPEYHEHQHFRIKSVSKAEIAVTLAMIENLIQHLEDKKLDFSGGPRKSPAPVDRPAEPAVTSLPKAPAAPAHAQSHTPTAAPATPPPPSPKQSSPPPPVAQAPVSPQLPRPAASATPMPPIQPFPSPQRPSKPQQVDAAPERGSDQRGPDDRRVNSLELIRKVCIRFHAVSRQLRQRGEYRTTLEVEDEHDVRDVVHALLLLEFEEIGTEDWTPSYAGAGRSDLAIQPDGIAIVVRKTKQGLGARELTEQVGIDARHYLARPDCKTLFVFIYDPEGRIGNPRRLEADLTRVSDRGDLEVLIAPK